MPPTDAQRIQHILDAIERVEARVVGLDEAAFAANDVVNVSLPIIWQTIKQNLPTLKSAMEQELTLSGRESRGHGG